MITALDSEQARGEAFEEFCHAFFKLQSRLYQIKDVWRFRNSPPPLLERLGTNTRQDKGIDGVLLHEDETITAYQAKFRIDRSSTPSQREVSTFYMVSDRADYRLIISNVDDLPVVVKERKDHGQILIDKLLELDGEFFSKLANLIRGKSAPDRPMLEPRPYQSEALTNIVAGLRKFGRGQAILACGAGKTLIGKWVSDHLDCETALVMVPSLALMRQTIGEWHHANSNPFRYLCVCSDSTVDVQSDDSWVINPSDLDCRVTTRPVDVVSFLGSSSCTTRVIFCTYQSGEVLANALKSEALSKFAFDLAICDEAHRLAGLSAKTFNHVLTDNSIRARWRLFMTATPNIFQPRLKDTADKVQAEVYSMDNQIIFGPLLYRFGFQKAIQEKVICDYQIVVIGVNEEETNKLALDREVLRTIDSGRWSTEGLAQRIALGKAISTYGVRKIFSFHSRVAAASRFVDGQLPDSFTSLMKQIAPQTDFLASHISGVMSSGVRAKILRDFEAANRGVIANAKCLGEGVNVPIVDGVFFADPKDSVIDIVQATGRALRRKENKETAYVIIPVLIRTGEDPEKVFKSSRFNNVWTVLSAMSSQDDRLQATMAQAAISKGENGDEPTPRTSMTDVKGMTDYRTVVIGFPADLLQVSEYQRLFTLEAVEKTGDRWFVQFGALKRYVELNNKEPTTKTKFQGINLGAFLAKQRAAFRNKELAPEKLNLIAALGVSLSRNQWEQHLIACKLFLEANHRLPSASDTNASGMKIGQWLADLRRNLLDNMLSEAKSAKIEEFLGVAWRDYVWNRKFEAYKNYVQTTGLQPWARTRHEGVEIGAWLRELRSNPASLSQEQIDRLHELGLTPPIDFEEVESKGMLERERVLQELMKQQERDLHAINKLTDSDLDEALDEDQLRSKIALQADGDWLQYYAWCKEGVDSGASPLSKVPDEMKRNVGVWVKYQLAQYRSKELSEPRRRLFESLLYSKRK